MNKTYDPHSIEAHWYPRWEQQGYFAPQGQGPMYCIMIPPPNVTGTLHMGHAFQDTIMDTLTRYHRMRGHNTLWQPGTDHAGIATQIVVERQLNAAGTTRDALGRDAFIEKVWAWKQQSGDTITRQLRRLGASADWSRERFTMDEGLSAAVSKVFVQLYDEGLIYRGKRLVNWDPVLQTAVSDLEVVSSEEQGSLWHLRYPLADDSGEYLVVATTRPETMLGDVAVAVHPDDERYQRLIGKTLRLPLCDREIPIIADTYVDPTFGSGCVKITPAHDFNDYEVGQRHQLEQRNIFTSEAKINDQAPQVYQGLDRFAARKQIIADLEQQGLLERIQPHTLMVPRCERTQQIIEPLLTDQWYVHAKPLADAGVAAVQNGRIKFVPEQWTKTYYNWMENIQDWCISRQIWWGHQIPAWYDQAGNVYVAESETAVREKYQLAADVQLDRDADVLDTWFSSALWPFSTLGWPEKTAELSTFYPTSVLVTGFDIIFFWVARMIMMGLKFMGDVPFREVYIHGLVRDSEGQKMSKSKGNVLDPLDLIDGIDLESLVKKRTTGLMRPEDAPKIDKLTRKQFPDGIPSYGTDALRFTFAALASNGRDIRFDLKRVEGNRNFCNKLWNASRYVLMNTEAQTLNPNAELGLVDRWIMSRLQASIQQVNEHLQAYRFDLAAQTIYDFTWNEYCDWYLELTKPILSGTDTAAADASRYTLIHVLETLLRLLHPIMPFITEELWQTIGPMAGQQGDSIMLQSYPQIATEKLDSDAEDTINWLQSFVLGVRRIRAEYDIAPGKRLAIFFAEGSEQDLVRLTSNQTLIQSLTRLQSITCIADSQQAPESAIALAGNGKILIPLAGLIDVAAEQQRLEKEIGKRQQEVDQLQVKLANPNFVNKAKPEVVDKERTRLEESISAVAQLKAQLEKIQQMQNS